MHQRPLFAGIREGVSPLGSEIAKLVGIGPDCVKAHLSAAFAHLNAASRAEAVAIALQKGLLKT